MRQQRSRRLNALQHLLHSTRFAEMLSRSSHQPGEISLPDRSAIRLTGQYWKVGVGVLALLVGSFAPLFAATGISWTSGTILAVAGYSFSCVAVRCPDCGIRWLWQAALDAGLYPHLYKRSTCPACKRDYARSQSPS